jgi:hypothetical protein
MVLYDAPAGTARDVHDSSGCGGTYSADGGAVTAAACAADIATITAAVTATI